MAEPTMAPAASPPSTPTATPQPRQWACAENGNAAARLAAAAKIIKLCFMGALSRRISFGADHPPKVVTRPLRADEPRTAPADEIAVTITQRAAGPIAARACGRVRGTVAFIHDVAGGGRVVARPTVRNCAANNGAADDAGGHASTNCAAIATRVGGGRGAQSADSQRADGCERKDRLLHRCFLQGQVGRRRP